MYFCIGKSLKSAPKCFFSFYPKKYGLDLSKEVMWILPEKGVAKL